MQVTEIVLKQREVILFLFQIVKVLLIGLITTLFIVGLIHDDFLSIASRMGILLGQASVILLLAALVPGIVRRLNVLLMFNSMLMPFRRQLGILMYLSGMGHWLLNTFIFEVSSGDFFYTRPPFVLMGISALLLTTPLFLTSNNFSVKRLGKAWGKLHKLVYLCLLLILMHVALQSSKWAIPIVAWLALEVLSYGVFWYRHWQQKRLLL